MCVASSIICDNWYSSYMDLSFLVTVIIWINAAAFIKFLVLKVRRLFQGDVYSRAAFIANFVTTTVNLLFNLKLNLTNFNTQPKKLRIKFICLLNLYKYIWKLNCSLSYMMTKFHSISMSLFPLWSESNSWIIGHASSTSEDVYSSDACWPRPNWASPLIKELPRRKHWEQIIRESHWKKKERNRTSCTGKILGCHHGTAHRRSFSEIAKLWSIATLN